MHPSAAGEATHCLSEFCEAVCKVLQLYRLPALGKPHRALQSMTDALPQAVAADACATVLELLRAGADADASGRNGVYPVTKAAHLGSLEIVNVLISARECQSTAQAGFKIVFRAASRPIHAFAPESHISACAAVMVACLPCREIKSWA